MLLIPLLSMLAGLGIHEAMATALATFVTTGLIGTYLFHRKGSIDWRLTVPVCSGAPMFGFAGAYVNSMTNAELLGRWSGPLRRAIHHRALAERTTPCSEHILIGNVGALILLGLSP
ncbi:MAG: TSUP family transporter [Thioalkalivibrio sp.]